MDEWDPDERRLRTRHLTPLSGELTLRDLDEELERVRRAPRERLARLLRRRGQRRRRHWIVGGLVRLTLATIVASGLAFLIAAVLDRPAAIGFYLSGGLVMAAGFLVSSAPARVVDVGVPEPERQRRLQFGVVFVVVGAITVGIGVVLEVFV